MNIPDFMLAPAANATLLKPEFVNRAEAVTPGNCQPEAKRERAQFVPGVFPNMPASVYHEIESMSASGAKRMLQSPAHYKLMRTTANIPTPAMQFGTAVHSGVLEPETFDAAVVVAPTVNNRTKDGKAELAEFEAAHPSAVILSPADFDRARRCVDAVRAHPAAARLLSGAEVETSCFWNDREWGTPCKMRTDARNLGGIVDLKTAVDASPEGFARAIANFDYHVQAAFYMFGAEHCFDATPAFFVFIAVESAPPHGVGCYAMPANGILAGARRANLALERYRDALASGKFPGYPDTIETIALPKWALRFDN